MCLTQLVRENSNYSDPLNYACSSRVHALTSGPYDCSFIFSKYSTHKVLGIFFPTLTTEHKEHMLPEYKSDVKTNTEFEEGEQSHILPF